MKIIVDMRQAKRLEKMLGDMSKKSVKYAQKNTLNDLAFEARKEAVNNVRNDFMNRNTWTERSIRVNRATSLGSSSELGSVEDYMRKHEMGGKSKMYGTTPGASGENPRSRVRRRVVRAASKINRIGQADVLQGAFGSRQERNIATLKDAKAKGKRFVKMRKGAGRVGIYRVLGSKSNPRAQLLYTVRSQRLVVKKQPWLEPAARKVQSEQGATIYFARMRAELRRLGAK